MFEPPPDNACNSLSRLIFVKGRDHIRSLASGRSESTSQRIACRFRAGGDMTSDALHRRPSSPMVVVEGREGSRCDRADDRIEVIDGLTSSARCKEIEGRFNTI